MEKFPQFLDSLMADPTRDDNLYMANIRFVIFLILILESIFLFANSGARDAHATSNSASFPRIANYFLRTVPDINQKTYDTLSRYDLLILPMEAQAYNREFFDYARKKNPDIIILPYVPSRSINILDLDDGALIRKRMKDGIRDSWYLRDSSGRVVQAWPGTIPVNVTSEWNFYLPQYIQKNILSTGLWDGIFYDEVHDSMTYLNGGDIDINGNGISDPKKEADALWQDGMLTLFKNTRERIGNDPIIITNGSSLPQYERFVNGRMFENFPSPKGHGAWLESMRSYLHLNMNDTLPPITIINTTTLNTGNKNDFRALRFGLASALLSNGYFAFDYGDKDHGQLWQYDEYDIHLGKPTTPPQNVLAGMSTNIQESVWRRDFLQGTVFVNATARQQVFELEEEFEKIRGTQDSGYNDGSIISEIDLAPYDGVILLRPLNTILEKPFFNGSFARIFDANGAVKRNGFFAYDQNARGSAAVIISDAVPERGRMIISADKGVVSVRVSGGEMLYTIQPFGKKWKFPLFIALGKEGDKVSLLAVAPARTDTKKQKNGSMVKIYDILSGKERVSFQPFGKKFKGTLSIAFGDMDSDGNEELITGAGAGTEPRVRVFKNNGRATKTNFLAYGKKFRGGVSVSSGDVLGLGNPQIITSPGPGTSPVVKLFSLNGTPLEKTFSLPEKNRTHWTRMTTADLDADGTDEIITFTANVFTIAGLTQ